jgi:hypothetical protein
LFFSTVYHLIPVQMEINTEREWIIKQISGDRVKLVIFLLIPFITPYIEQKFNRFLIDKNKILITAEMQVYT